MSKINKDYTAEDLDQLEGLDPVRLRPGMYTHTDNPLHIFQEIIDNSIDEGLAGFAKTITVKMHLNGYLEVEDDGRGIPVDVNSKTGKTGVEMVFTNLHKGAKFRKADKDSQYRISGGLHGVGAAVTNALSLNLEVEVHRNGKCHSMSFEGGYTKTSLKGRPASDKIKRGTRVWFKPDPKYFGSAEVPRASVERLLKAKAVLLPQVAISLHREVSEGVYDIKEWAYPEGILTYLQELTLSSIVVGSPFVGSLFATDSVYSKSDPDLAIAVEGEGVEWAIAWTEDAHSEGSGESYVNLIPTVTGGTHIAGFRLAVFNAIREYAEANSLVPKDLKINSDDVWRNVKYVLSAKLVDPSFYGQVKERLDSPGIYAYLSAGMKPVIWQWLLDNGDRAKTICKLAIANATARASSRPKTERKKSIGGSTLPGKLYDCATKNTEESELFIVEGDSAGGSLSQARERQFQALLPIKGKIENVWSKVSHKIRENEEIDDILTALNIDPHVIGTQDALANMRYGKIIIATDADDDGSHIRVLLYTLFLRHTPEVIAQGRVYVAQAPLHKLDYDSEGKSKPSRKLYALDDFERDALIKRMKKEGYKKDPEVGRFKGLGEMNPSELWDTTINPDTRRLVRVTLSEEKDEQEETLTIFDFLMHKKHVPWRRAWMGREGNLVEDD